MNQKRTLTWVAGWEAFIHLTNGRTGVMAGCSLSFFQLIVVSSILPCAILLLWMIVVVRHLILLYCCYCCCRFCYCCRLCCCRWFFYCCWRSRCSRCSSFLGIFLFLPFVLLMLLSRSLFLLLSLLQITSNALPPSPASLWQSLQQSSPKFWPSAALWHHCWLLIH